MLPGQMSLWQLGSVKDVPRNLPLKFGQNQVGNRWNIVDVAVVGGVVGVVCGVVFVAVVVDVDPQKLPLKFAESEKDSNLPWNRFDQSQTFLTYAVNFRQKNQMFPSKMGKWNPYSIIPLSHLYDNDIGFRA